MLLQLSSGGIYPPFYNSGWESGTFLFNVGPWCSIATHRLLLHRLHRFPGPFFAKLSMFYTVRIQSSTFKIHVKHQQLHEQYGDFVRVGSYHWSFLCLALTDISGPRELSINRASAIPVIYGTYPPSPRYFSDARIYL